MRPCYNDARAWFNELVHLVSSPSGTTAPAEQAPDTSGGTSTSPAPPWCPHASWQALAGPRCGWAEHEKDEGHFVSRYHQWAVGLLTALLAVIASLQFTAYNNNNNIYNNDNNNDNDNNNNNNNNNDDDDDDDNNNNNNNNIIIVIVIMIMIILIIITIMMIIMIIIIIIIMIIIMEKN